MSKAGLVAPWYLLVLLLKLELPPKSAIKLKYFSTSIDYYVIDLKL
ncbi:hypothetical protein C3B79_3139 [Aeromonas hydrophila]|nr:hypothetical protein C3B79_3139 [Aeromonas hydrophila]